MLLVVAIAIVLVVLGSSDDAALWSLLEGIVTQARAVVDWVLRIPDPLYDLIDRFDGSPGVVTEHVEYWTATVFALVVLACLARVFVLPFLAVHRHRSWDLVNRRYKRGKAAAEAALPNSHIPRSALPGFRDPGVDHRAWRKAVALREPTPKYLLRGWARLEYVEERFVDAVDHVLRAFGAGFVGYPRLRSALRPAVVIVATAAVFTNRPIEDQGKWIEEALHDTWTWITSPVPGRLVPLAVLILGVLVFIRATPVIDQIRARDEAAKDVNRLLGQLHGGLERLSFAVWKWREDLEDHRTRLVIKWVEEATDGRYSWSYDGGIYAVEHDAYRDGERFSDTDFDAGPLVEALGDVAELEARIQETGFEHVAVNLTWPVHDSLRELDLLQGHVARVVAADIPRRRGERFPVPSGIAEMFEGLSRQPKHLVRELERARTRTPSHGRTSGPLAAQHEPPTEKHLTMVRRLETELEAAAFDGARLADGCLAELLVKEMHLHRITRFLWRRARGSAITRPLGAIQK